MAQAAEPPSGTRDFLADDVRRRKVAFDTIGAVFERYGFDPLETPAFERLEVFAGKLGEDASSLIFKILKRGVHEASGEADLALRYDHTVPLARVVATYGSRLPSPYKRYAIGPVWRADRAAKGRFREFAQCDVDTVGSASPLADAEIVCVVHDGLAALGISDFQFHVNSRQALHGLLEAYHVDPELGDKVLGSLDKLDKVTPDAVCAELVERGLTTATAEGLVADVTAPDTGRVRKQVLGPEPVHVLVVIAEMAARAEQLGIKHLRSDDFLVAVHRVAGPHHPGRAPQGRPASRAAGVRDRRGRARRSAQAQR